MQGVEEGGQGATGERAAQDRRLKGVCCIVGFTSLHYYPKDKNRAQKQRRVYFLFCFYINWRNSTCQSKETALSVIPGGLEERRPAFWAGQGSGNED